jgi:putative DNA primase/helicase
MVENAFSTRPTPVRLLVILQAIKQGRWREQVARIRHLYNSELKRTGSHEKAKKAVEHLKKNLPGVMWSGTFSQRGNEYLLQYSSLFCADIDVDALGGMDLKEVRAKLQTSPYVVAVFLSPTGYGLKVIFKVPADASKHSGSFRAVRQLILELTGVQIDESGKDLARLCFVTDDPDLYLNPNAQEITPLPRLQVLSSQTAQKTRQAEWDSKPSKEQIREMLRFIPKRPEYDDWIKVVAAVGDAVGDTISLADAIELLCEWSPEEEEGEYAKKLSSGLERVHVASLIYWAQQHGWGPVPDLWKGSAHPSRNAEAQSDEETIRRLAAMSLPEYERVRKAEAEKLGYRVSALDLLVAAKRPLSNPHPDSLKGAAVTVTDVEPWPEPVNGAMVLEAIAERISHYVMLPPGAADACALWCAHTHCFTSFQKSPRLHISAPTEECGKSTLCNCLSLFCAKAKRTDNMTTAVMFRLVSGHSPTILADECDKWLFRNEELVGLVQSGHEKGGTVIRCEGDSNELREFGCYAPFVLAAIGTLPSQLHSRSICIRLERAKPEEIKRRSRFDLEHVEYETELNRKLARWVADNRERIQSCDPKLPAHLFNRIADNWRPLFKIAEAAGGNWPCRCADALAKLTTREDERENLRVMLLVDIKQVFTVERMFSKDLVEQLTELKERPWPEVCRGKAITQNWLARNLAPFDIQPGNIRIDDEQAKGYELADFKEAFERYIPSSHGRGGISSVPPSQSEEEFSNASVPTLGKMPNFHPSQNEENAKNATVPKNSVGTDGKNAPTLGVWDGGTVRKGGARPNEYINPDSGGKSGQKTTPATPPEQPTVEPVPAHAAAQNGASMSFIITRKQKAELRRLGFTQAQIDRFSPPEAHEILAAAAGPVAGVVVDEKGVGEL